MIGIINYGLGNLGSIQNMIKKVGGKSEIIDTPDKIDRITKLILPGVGAYDRGMKLLNDKSWRETLDSLVLKKGMPTLGICLGMQLMTNSSQEGELKGLGWIDAETIKFEFSNGSLKIPHMGWNIAIASKYSSLIPNQDLERRFYFVHSYYVKLKYKSDSLFETNYGHQFTSGFERDNIIGVQFHPEKSHKFGMELMRNFVEKY